MGTSLGMVSLVGRIEEVERDTWTGLMIDCVIAEILLKLRPDSEREDWRRSALSAAALIWYGISAYRENIYFSKERLLRGVFDSNRRQTGIRDGSRLTNSRDIQRLFATATDQVVFVLPMGS